MAITVPSMQDLLGAGVHFGHQVRRGHPKMGRFIYGARDGVHIIDLAKSEEQLKKALEFVHNLGKENKVLLVVGTKKQSKEIIETLSLENGANYITESWIGGLLTNFEEIKRNIKKLIDLRKEKEQGLLSRYTKKEQGLLDKKLSKFQKIYRGIENLEKMPDAMFIVDCVAEKTSVTEAVQMGVLLVGLNDTNSDPSLVDYPIPGNDDGIKSIKIICEAVIGEYGKGKKEVAVIKEGEPADKTKTAEAVQPKADRSLDEKKSTDAKAMADEGTKKLKKDEKIIEAVEKDQKQAVDKETAGSMDETKEEVSEAAADAVVEEVAEIEEKIEKASLADSERKV